MNANIRVALCIVFASTFISFAGAAKQIHNRHYKFTITIPDAMSGVPDTGAEGELYYDSTARIVLMISERESKFHSVDEYIDCSRKELESQLKEFYSDSTLTLVNCSRSPYYPGKSAVILFHVSVLPYGFNTCVVYFIHHRHEDLQFSFTYKDEKGKDTQQYINAIMQTLALK